jgi:hypothetical protein
MSTKKNATLVQLLMQTLVQIVEHHINMHILSVITAVSFCHLRSK